MHASRGNQLRLTRSACLNKVIYLSIVIINIYVHRQKINECQQSQLFPDGGFKSFRVQLNMINFVCVDVVAVYFVQHSLHWAFVWHHSNVNDFSDAQKQFHILPMRFRERLEVKYILCPTRDEHPCINFGVSRGPKILFAS